jgi:hypothetical protein
MTNRSELARTMLENIASVLALQGHPQAFTPMVRAIVDEVATQISKSRDVEACGFTDIALALGKRENETLLEAAHRVVAEAERAASGADLDDQTRILREAIRAGATVKIEFPKCICKIHYSHLGAVKEAVEGCPVHGGTRK